MAKSCSKTDLLEAGKSEAGDMLYRQRCSSEKEDDSMIPTESSGTKKNRRKLVIKKQVVDDTSTSSKNEFSTIFPTLSSEENNDSEESKSKNLAPMAGGLPSRCKTDFKLAEAISQKNTNENNPHPLDLELISKISDARTQKDTNSLVAEETRNDSDKEKPSASERMKATSKRKEQYKRSCTIPSTFYSISRKPSQEKSELECGNEIRCEKMKPCGTRNKNEELNRPFRSLESLRDKTVPKIIVHETATLENMYGKQQQTDHQQSGHGERFAELKHSALHRKLSENARVSLSFDYGEYMLPISAEKIKFSSERRASFDCTKSLLNPILPKRQSLPEEALTKSLSARKREGCKTPLLNQALPVPLQCVPPLSPPPRGVLVRQEEVQSPKNIEEYSRQENIRRRISREFMSLDALESPSEALEFDFSDGQKLSAYFRHVEMGESGVQGAKDELEARKLTGAGKKTPKPQRRYSDGRYQEYRSDTPTPPAIYLPPIDCKSARGFLSLPPVIEKQKRRFSEGQMLRKLAAESDDVTEKLSHLALSPRLPRRATSVKTGRAKKYTVK